MIYHACETELVCDTKQFSTGNNFYSNLTDQLINNFHSQLATFCHIPAPFSICMRHAGPSARSNESNMRQKSITHFDQVTVQKSPNQEEVQVD